MNLHRITYCIGKEERQEFAGSDGAASKRCTELKKETGLVGKPERASCEVPTSKAELIEWLNKNAMLVSSV